MPVEQTFETKEEAPEWLHAHLVEDGGKFVFRGETAAEVENLRKTTKKERDARALHEKEVNKLKERFKSLLDTDDDELNQFLEAYSKRSDNGNKDKPDSREQELKDKLHQKELKKVLDERDGTKTELEQARIELRGFRLWSPLRDMAIKAGLVPEDWPVVKLHLESLRLFDLDEDHKPVLIEDGSPSSVSPERWFKEVYAEQQPKFFKASGAGGGGANPGQKPGSTNKSIKREAFDKLSTSEREARIKSGFAIVD